MKVMRNFFTDPYSDDDEDLDELEDNEVVLEDC